MCSKDLCDCYKMQFQQTDVSEYKISIDVYILSFIVDVFFFLKLFLIK